MSDLQQLRKQAELLVKSRLDINNRYSCVSYTDCTFLLGRLRFEALLADPIRRYGPTPATVYSWNVVDYLCKEIEFIPDFQI
jgi:hypothetical protein